MTDTIKRTHFSLLKEAFNPPALPAGLCLRETKPTSDKVISRVKRIPFNWIKKRIYDDDVLPRRIVTQNMRLFDLFSDANESKPIGYSIIVTPEGTIRGRYLPDADNPIEIENIALYRPRIGQGSKYLKLVQNKLFQEGHDVIYLNTSETNYPTLPDFYRRCAMSDLGQDEVENFNNRRHNSMHKPSPFPGVHTPCLW